MATPAPAAAARKATIRLLKNRGAKYFEIKSLELVSPATTMTWRMKFPLQRFTKIVVRNQKIKSDKKIATALVKSKTTNHLLGLKKIGWIVNILFITIQFL